MSLWYYHPKMILRSDALPAFKVAAPRSNGFIPATRCLRPEQSRPLKTLTTFDERGAATFAHLASEQTIAQLLRQVYYVNKYATNFCVKVGNCLQVNNDRTTRSRKKRSREATLVSAPLRHATVLCFAENLGQVIVWSEEGSRDAECRYDHTEDCYDEHDLPIPKREFDVGDTRALRSQPSLARLSSRFRFL